ncbi:hypothetical protein BDZ94DRAFT_1274861 [Collybia nuda]|uniref:Uncharacterized protein n=1 Tax=Collybia nuda TaxID=64659 RepID=A0A9P5XTV2_9AGAR|nr:hypothetical protein BDZ94DRAFT_1274861 [Collybia nuda]
METIGHTSNLCSLSEWSIQHIRNVFEARSDEQSLRAIAATFSEDVSATVNGVPLSREGIDQLVLAMRRGSSGGLRVQWQQAIGAPWDPATNRGGAFTGAYIIRGIQKLSPGAQKPVEFERHKTVNVQIESQSSNPHLDSRRIVNLAFFATDVRVDRQASL